MMEKDKLIGFVFIGNDTWQPKQLYIARKKQRQKTARQAKTGIIWASVKPSIQIG